MACMHEHASAGREPEPAGRSAYLQGQHGRGGVHAQVDLAQLPAGIHAGQVQAHREGLLRQAEGDVQQVQQQPCKGSQTWLTSRLHHNNAPWLHGCCALCMLLSTQGAVSSFLASRW